MKQILFRLFENLKQLGIKPNIGSRTNVTPIPGSEIDRLINRPVAPKEFDYSKPEVVDSIRGIVKNASDYVGQFTERQAKTFNDNIERILNVIKPKETTADVVDLATKEKITGPGLESLMKEKGVPSISRKTIEAETLIKQFLDDDLISLNAKQIDQLSRGKAEDVFENIFGSKAKELITGKNTNESLNEVYNKLKTTKDVKGRLPDDPSFDPSDIEFKEGGSVSEDVRQLLKEEFIKIINEDPEAYPDTNAGFRRFLKRKGAPVFNYKDGGEVEEKEEKDILEKFGTLYKRKKEKKDGKLGPTDPLSKYESYSEEELAGNIEAKKPNFDTLEDYIMETMPMFEPRDVAPPKSYSPMPVEEYLRRRFQIDLAKGGRVKKRKRYADGGVASMFRERTRYAEGGTYPSFIDGPNGIKFELVTGRFSGKPVYKAKYPEDYDFSKGAIGGSTATEFDPDQINQIAIEEQNRRENLLGKTFPEGYFDPATYEIPTVDPFSGQQVSAQDQAAFTQPQAEIFPQQELPTVTPEAPFQPYEAQSTPYDFISSQLQNIFNNPAVKGYSNFITGSGNPFQDINQFTTAQQNVINQAIQNATNQGRTNITYADYPQTGIAQLMDDGFTPMEYLKTLGSSMFGNPVDQIKTTLGQFSYNPETNKIFDRYDFQRQSGNNLGTPYDVNINLRNNPVQRTVNVGSSDIGTQALGASVGNLDFATINALRNNADLLNTITGQTVNMANGGLTNTIPPARGPNSQGVESLFTRRYN
jgi:hypothetical protein